MKSVVLIAAVILSGCATKTYFHTSIADKAEVERMRVIDDAYCTSVALGASPTPIQTYPQSNTGPSFSSGFAKGSNAGAAIAARMNQNKIHHGCMLSKGWSDVEIKPSEQRKKTSAQDDAKDEWRQTVDQFIKTEAIKDGGIDYRRDEFKLMQLDSTVKQLASDPKNNGKTMLWFLVEADRIVKEYYSPERSWPAK